MQIDETLLSGIQAFEQNDIDTARAIFGQAVRENPRSEQGWLWLGRCLENPDQQRECYRRVLAIDPSNEIARQELARLSGPLAPAAPATPGAEQPQPPVSLPPQAALDSAGEPPEAPPASKKPARFSRPAVLAGVALGLILGLACLLYITWRFVLNQPPGSSQPTRAQALAATAAQTVAPSPTTAPSATPTPRRTAAPPTPVVPYSGPPRAEVFDMISQGKFKEALPHLDQLITSYPEDSLLYYNRATAYLVLSGSQPSPEEFEAYLQHALADVDRSIALAGDAPQGNLYYVRYEIYDRLSSLQPRRVDQQFIAEVALENLLAADSLGNTIEYSDRNIPFLYFALHRCEEGIASLQRVLDEQGPSAPPNVPLLNMQAQAHLCQGDLEKALETVNRGLEIEPMKGNIWFRAILLTQLGRYPQALEDLNDLIEDQPKYNGYRYHLRALVHYELGKRQAAAADLQTGDSNTWQTAEVRSYLLARTALDQGDRQKAVRYFQEAVETLPWIYVSLIERSKAYLAELGAAPLPETPSISLSVTPLPPFQPARLPEDVTAALATRAAGGVLPPMGSSRVSLADGIGPGSYNNASDLLYRFSPPEPVSISAVRRLALRLEPQSSDQPTKFEIFLWDQRSGEWAMVRPGWGETEIQNPERFVTPEGEVYLYIRIDSEYTVEFKKIALQIAASGKDGAPVNLGPGQ